MSQCAQSGVFSGYYGQDCSPPKWVELLVLFPQQSSYQSIRNILMHEHLEISLTVFNGAYS